MFAIRFRSFPSAASPVPMSTGVVDRFHQTQKQTRMWCRKASSLTLLMLTIGGTHEARASDFFSEYFAGVPAASAPYTPGVTLYGVVDEAVGFTKGAKTTIGEQSGGQWTSKIGFFGVEDLGGGFRARFNLENGFNASTGALGSTNTAFNREAWVAIGSRSTGEVKLGLQDDIGVPLFVDVFGQVGTVSAVAYLTDWTYDLGPGASFEAARLQNTISYTSPWLGPINAQLAASFNNGTGPTVTTRSAALNYYDGRMFGTLAYVGNYGLNALTTSSYVRTDNFAAGVVYNTRNLVLSGGYSFLAPRLAGDRVASLYTVGGIYKLAQRHDFRLELAYRAVAGTTDKSFGATLGYDYDLSSRTALYVRGTVIKNQGTAPKYAGYPSSVQPTVDSIATTYTGSNGALESYQAPHAVIVGMYHKF